MYETILTLIDQIDHDHQDGSRALRDAAEEAGYPKLQEIECLWSASRDHDRTPGLYKRLRRLAAWCHRQIDFENRRPF